MTGNLGIKVLEAALIVCLCTSLATATINTPSAAKLTAAEIANRNAVARGGLQKWRSVQTMKLSGKMEAGGNSRAMLQMPGRKDARFMPPPRPAEQVRLPFVMEAKRPGKLRVEIDFANQTAIQVYDGTHGWKLRPFLNRLEVEPYTNEELKAVATQAELDGPLMDYAAKGTTIALEGHESVGGRDCYRLKLSLKNGQTQNVWIDAGTYLESKIQGVPRRMDGRYVPVEIFYRDYRSVGGLQIPFLVETMLVGDQIAGSSGAFSREQILIDKVEVNPLLPDLLFSRQGLDKDASSSVAVSASGSRLPQ